MDIHSRPCSPNGSGPRGFQRRDVPGQPPTIIDDHFNLCFSCNVPVISTVFSLTSLARALSYSNSTRLLLLTMLHTYLFEGSPPLSVTACKSKTLYEKHGC